jgi:hypothetical protein
MRGLPKAAYETPESYSTSVDRVIWYGREI